MTDPSCETAHGETSDAPTDRTLVVVYVSPLADCLLRWGAELGFDVVLLEPDRERHGSDVAAHAGRVIADPMRAPVDAGTDVVVTDHHRDDLGPVMASLVRSEPRWIGIIGSPRHEPAHVAAMQAQGVDEDLIERVQRPIGIDIGSRTPPEIALSVLAGLVADRNGRDAGRARSHTAVDSR